MKKQLESLVAYIKPTATACELQTESILQSASGNAGTIGAGGGGGDAKQGWFEEEEEETASSDESKFWSPWED